MSTYFKCKNCQSEHRSPAGFVDRVSFDASPMPVSRFRCETTGRAATYDKQDMYWREDHD